MLNSLAIGYIRVRYSSIGVNKLMDKDSKIYPDHDQFATKQVNTSTSCMRTWTTYYFPTKKTNIWMNMTMTNSSCQCKVGIRGDTWLLSVCLWFFHFDKLTYNKCQQCLGRVPGIFCHSCYLPSCTIYLLIFMSYHSIIEQHLISQLLILMVLSTLPIQIQYEIGNLA